MIKSSHTRIVIRRVEPAIIEQYIRSIIDQTNPTQVDQKLINTSYEYVPDPENDDQILINIYQDIEVPSKGRDEIEDEYSQEYHEYERYIENLTNYIVDEAIEFRADEIVVIDSSRELTDPLPPTDPR